MPHHKISNETKKKLARISYLSKVYNDALAEQMQYKKQRMRRRRTFWSHEWLKQRDNDQSTVYSKIEEEDPEQFFNAFRMNKETFYKLLNRIEHILERENTNMRKAISAKVRLQVTLCYLATGSSFKMLSEAFRIHNSTISKIVPIVCNAIWNELSQEEIKCPKTEQEWLEKANDFNIKWNYPWVLVHLMVNTV